VVGFFHSEVLINARASTVWHVLTDGANFGVWESGILEAGGPVRSGDTIRTLPVNGRPSLKLRVHQLDGEVMTWNRCLPLGLGDLIRTFTLTPEAAKTRLAVTEDHRGLLLPFSEHADDDPHLDRFTEAVRVRSEILDRVPFYVPD